MFNANRLLVGILLFSVVGTVASVPGTATAANIRPLHDRVLVKRLDPERRSRGIVIPDSAKDRATQGVVIEVGPGRRSDSGERVPVDVKSGDVVLFGKYSGTEVNIDGEEFLILREDDILGFVEE